MKNWYLNLIVVFCVAVIFGMFASWVASIFTGYTTIQQGVGFLSAGVFLTAVDFLIRNRFDSEGVYLQMYFFFFPVFRIPAWVFGLVFIVGGTAIFSSPV